MVEAPAPYEDRLRTEGTFRTYLDRMQAISSSREFQDKVVTQCINEEMQSIHKKLLTLHEIINKQHSGMQKSITRLANHQTNEIQALKRNTQTNVQNTKDECAALLESTQGQSQLRLDSLEEKVSSLNREVVSNQQFLQDAISERSWEAEDRLINAVKTCEQEFDRKLQAAVSEIKDTMEAKLENQKIWLTKKCQEMLERFSVVEKAVRDVERVQIPDLVQENTRLERYVDERLSFANNNLWGKNSTFDARLFALEEWRETGQAPGGGATAGGGGVNTGMSHAGSNSHNTLSQNNLQNNLNQPLSQPMNQNFTHANTNNHANHGGKASNAAISSGVNSNANLMPDSSGSNPPHQSGSSLDPKSFQFDPNVFAQNRDGGGGSYSNSAGVNANSSSGGATQSNPHDRQSNMQRQNSGSQHNSSASHRGPNKYDQPYYGNSYVGQQHRDHATHQHRDRGGQNRGDHGSQQHRDHCRGDQEGGDQEDGSLTPSNSSVGESMVESPAARAQTKADAISRGII